MNELKTIFGTDVPGYLSVNIARGGHFYADRFFRTDDLDAMQAYMLEKSVTETVYYSWNVLEHIPSGGRGVAEDFHGSPGVFFDFDLKQDRPGIHKAENLPASKDEIDALLAAIGMPMPSSIVHSGHGFYYRYLFDDAVLFSTEADRIEHRNFREALHRHVAGEFARNELKLDNVSDLPRVTRLVGTFNHKTNPPKPVMLLEHNEDRRYAVSELKELARRTSASTRNLHAVSGLPKSFGVPSAIKREEAGKAEITKVNAGCAWLRGWFEDPVDRTYEDWLALAGVLKHCSDGEATFHQISKADPRYNFDEADKLYKSVTGPMTCEFIAASAGSPHCAKCPALVNRHVGSPVSFGRAENHYLAAVAGSTVYINKRESFKSLPDDRSYTKQNFTDHYMRWIKSPVSTALSSKLLLQVPTSEYLPGVHDLFFFAENHGLVLNTWTPSPLGPVFGNCDLILGHFAYLAPNTEEREHFLDVLAHAIQKPRDKIRHCILLIGGQGTGKSFLSELLSRLFGSRNVFVVDNDLLSSRFNAQMADRQVLVLEEVGQNDRAEAYNDLKMWVTQDKVQVEEKHQPRYEGSTPRLMIGFSNRSVPIKIENDDRRFMFIDSPKMPREQAYYEKLFSEGLDQAAAFFDHLLRRNISGFSPNAHPPSTHLKHSIVAASRPAVEAEVAVMIEQGDDPFDREMFRLSDLSRALMDRVDRRANMSGTELARVLRLYGYDQVEVGQIRVGKTAYRLWTKANSKWISVTPDEVRQYILSDPLL